jgi:dTDP-4-dehydrorhamnose reductase
MKVLVTGRDGQLARSLAERAAGRDGMELVAVGRPELDLEVPGGAARAIAEASPNVVINAAAYTAVDHAQDEPDRAFRINADAACEVARAARDAGAAIIQMSTDYVFDGHSPEPYREDSAPNPLGAYGRSKLAGEERVRAANPDHLILRTAWVYSPFGRNFVKTMIAAAETREMLTVVDDQFGNPSSALDLADGILMVIDSWRLGRRTGLGETYHLAGSGSTSWCGFARAVMDECGALGLPQAEVRPIRTAEWPTKAVRPQNSTLDCAKFGADFGFIMPEWRRSLATVVERLVGAE